MSVGTVVVRANAHVAIHFKHFPDKAHPRPPVVNSSFWLRHSSFVFRFIVIEFGVDVYGRLSVFCADLVR